MKKKLKNYKTMIAGCDGKIFRQGFWVLADQCGYSLISFVISILLARACTKDVYGAFVLAMTFVFFSKVVQRSLVSVPFTVLYPRCHTEEQKRYFSHSVMQHLLVTMLLMTLVGLAALIGNYFEKPIGSVGLIGGFLLLIFCSLSADFIRTVMITRSKYKRCLITSIIIQICIIVLLAVYYYFGRLTVPIACLILSSGYGVFVLSGVLGMPFHVKPTRQWFVVDAQRNFKQGKWILSSTLVNYIGLQFLPWITLIWWDKDVVAIAGVLATLTCVLRPLLQAMIHYLTPRLSEMLQDGGLRRVRSHTLLMVHGLGLLSFCFVISIYFVGDQLVSRIYGPSYAGYQWALVLFSIATGLRVMNAPLRAMMTAVERSSCLVKSSLLASVASLILSVILIPAYAVEGIASIYVIYTLVTLIVNCLQVFRQETVCSIQTQVVPS